MKELNDIRELIDGLRVFEERTRATYAHGRDFYFDLITKELIDLAKKLEENKAD